MPKTSILISISFIIGIFCIRYIQSFDRHEKEPFWHMFAVTCWGGVSSVILSFMLYAASHYLGIKEFHNSFGALFVIGPVEELSKLVALGACYFIISKQMNEPVDGIIYMACVALGFSLIENYLYATQGVGNEYLLLLRVLICTPMHISFSVFMGLAFYICLQNRNSFPLLIYAFIYASLVHGLYDLVIFNGLFLLALMFIYKVTYTSALSFLGYAVAKSPFRKTLSQFIIEYTDAGPEEGLECLHCGSKEEKLTYKWDKLALQKCDHCDMYVATRKSIFLIFHRFASTFRKLDDHMTNASYLGKQYTCIHSNNFISEQRRLGFFNLEKLDQTLEEVNQKIIENMDKKIWFPSKLFQMRKRVASIDYQKAAADSGKAFWHWVIYPYSSDRNKTVHTPPPNGPAWNWKAFFIPELWFLYHEIHGVFLLVLILFLFFGSFIFFGIMIIYSKWMLLIILCGRIIAGRTGNQIYYARYGKWPD